MGLKRSKSREPDTSLDVPLRAFGQIRRQEADSPAPTKLYLEMVPVVVALSYKKEYFELQIPRQRTVSLPGSPTEQRGNRVVSDEPGLTSQTI